MMILHIVSIPANNLSLPEALWQIHAMETFDGLIFEFHLFEFDSACRDLVTTLGVSPGRNGGMVGGLKL